MERKGNWLSSVKKAFSPESKEKKAQKSKKSKKKWFGKGKTTVPDSSPEETVELPHRFSPPEEVTWTEVGTEQTKDDYSSEDDMEDDGIVAEPQAVEEVVQVTAVTQFTGIVDEEASAIKIQKAFRGYQARRGLRALRGLVRLKSLVQGPPAKRQTAHALRCMQTLARVQSQIQSRRIRMSEENQALQRQLLQKRAKELANLQIGEEWDASLQSKEQIEANLLGKYEAAMRRERAMAYSFSHQPAVMALTTPFVRIVQREKYDKINNTGHWYVLINVHGEQEVAAFSKTRSSKNLVYEAHAPFVAKYGQILPIGTATKWDLRKEMDAWFSRIIYYSFLYFFDDYNGKCWFMKYISPHDEAEDEDDDMFMPAVQENIFKIQNPNKWILLKVGGKVWPVHVINNKMEDGWLEFYLGNHLTEGYTVLFGCERAWIFEAIILDQNLERCNGAEHNDVNPPAVTLKTAWVPSVLLADDYALQFAYLWTPESSLNQVFTHRFQAILQDPTVHEIVFRMNNWTWNVPIKNGRFQSVGLQMLENELHLEDSNLIFIAVKDPSNIRVLVFCSNGVEKMYLWFYE